MFSERIEALSKLLASLAELSKSLAITGLAGFAVAAVAAPGWAKERLHQLGFHVEEFNWAGMKFVADETAKTSAGAMGAAEAITQAEIALAAAQQAPGAPAASSPASQRVADGLAQLNKAKQALDVQQAAIHRAAEKSGLDVKPPSLGWIHVADFGENGQPRWVSERLARNGIVRVDNRITQLVLAYDAPVVTNGDDCSRTDPAQFTLPPDDAPEIQYVIIQARGDEPLTVTQTKDCPSIGHGRDVWAQIKVPAARVRMAALSSLKK